MYHQTKRLAFASCFRAVIMFEPTFKATRHDYGMIMAIFSRHEFSTVMSVISRNSSPTESCLSYSRILYPFIFPAVIYFPDMISTILVLLFLSIT